MPIVRPRIVIALGALLATAACATLPDAEHPLRGKIWEPASGQFVAETDLLRRAATADVVLLGETHDNREHHRLQAEVLGGLLNRGSTPRLLMEQFDTDQQPAIDGALNDGRDLAPLLRGWDGAQYRRLLEMVRDHRLPLRAANLQREKLRPVVREGYATLPPGEGERLALLTAWDDAREHFMAGVIEATHCGKVSVTLRDGLVRAQRLRDASMADAVLNSLDRPVVFILGRGHARRDVGVPRYIELRRPGTRILSIGLVEVSADKTRPADYETAGVGDLPAFDLIWFTPRTAQPDPCLAFAR